MSFEMLRFLIKAYASNWLSNLLLNQVIDVNVIGVLFCTIF